MWHFFVVAIDFEGLSSFRALGYEGQASLKAKAMVLLRYPSLPMYGAIWHVRAILTYQVYQLGNNTDLYSGGSAIANIYTKALDCDCTFTNITCYYMVTIYSYRAFDILLVILFSFIVVSFL